MREPAVPDSDTDRPLLPRRACLKGLALGLAALPGGPLRGQGAAVRRDLTETLEPLRRRYGLPALAATDVRAGVINAADATGVRAQGSTVRVNTARM